GNAAPHQLRVARSQLCGAEAKPVSGARRQVLHEHIRAREQPGENLGCVAVLHIEREAFLGAVDPHEMRSEPVYGVVVVARGITGVRTLDPDHASAKLGELAGAERPGDDLLERDDRDPLERALHENVTVRPGSGSPRSEVVQVSPALTGCASVSTPVVMISPACSWGASGCFASTPMKCASAASGLPSTFAPLPRSTTAPCFASTTSRAGRSAASCGRSDTGVGVP